MQGWWSVNQGEGTEKLKEMYNCQVPKYKPLNTIVRTIGKLIYFIYAARVGRSTTSNSVLSVRMLTVQIT